MPGRELKFLRDKFVSLDGLTHIEANLQQVGHGPHVDAACGRWFAVIIIEYVPDSAKVTCLGCIHEEDLDG